MNRKKFLSLLAILSLAGFAAGTLISSAAETVAPAKKMIVLYYSYSGNTRTLAENIRGKTGSDIFEILPEKAYPKDYNECVKQAKKEIAENFRPTLKSSPQNIADYDTIFVGSPNWWGTYAPPIATLLDKPEFVGKTIVPFFTHGGGGIQRCEKNMKKQCAKSKFLKAITIYGSSVKSSETNERVDAWLRDIGIVK